MAIGSPGDAENAEDLDIEELALEGLKLLRSSPAYAVARSLELWRQQEEERAVVRLQEKEREMRERLEEEYRQRELQRAQSFRHQQAELREAARGRGEVGNGQDQKSQRRSAEVC